MPRSCSPVDEKKIIERCPSSSFETPEANKPVPIRPLKRFKNADGDAGEEEQASRSPSPVRGELSPRRLDMDQVWTDFLDPALSCIDSAFSAFFRPSCWGRARCPTRTATTITLTRHSETRRTTGRKARSPPRRSSAATRRRPDALEQDWACDDRFRRRNGCKG